jgi:uncharacterized metal-binding protein YceD (DUF177 family)
VWLASFLQVKVFAFFGKSTESDAALVKRVLLEALVPLDSKLERLSGDVFKLDQAVAKLDSKLERLSADASQMKVDLEVKSTTSCVYCEHAYSVLPHVK